MALSAFLRRTPRPKGTHSVLTGWLDQSALRGVLAEIEALGLVVLEVRQMHPREITGIRGRRTLMIASDTAPRHCTSCRSGNHRCFIR
jgi:hypothetical protein